MPKSCDTCEYGHPSEWECSNENSCVRICVTPDDPWCEDGCYKQRKCGCEYCTENKLVHVEDNLYARLRKLASGWAIQIVPYAMYHQNMNHSLMNIPVTHCPWCGREL